MKKEAERSRNDEPMDELLLQSQDNHRSIILSRNKSEQKSADKKTRNEDLLEVKNVLDFNNVEEEGSMDDHDINSLLHHTNSKFKKDLSKIIEDPKL
jgi:hypothetical protein